MKTLQISNEITRYRKINNLTQTQFANLFGVSPQAVSKWERNICCPDISLLADIADTLGISVGELLYGKEEKEG